MNGLSECHCDMKIWKRYRKIIPEKDGVQPIIRPFHTRSDVTPSTAELSLQVFSS